MNEQTFTHLLINWYNKFGRNLPWRVQESELANPYWVWISEIMLQQTTVQTVKSRFVKFIKRWPTVQELANASIDDVLHEWQGLGYYNRAHNLHKCANLIVKEYDGTFPSEVNELIKLPGIGQYTSSALAAIAFKKPVVAIDVNVDRVFSRLYALEETPSLRRKKIITKSKNFINSGNSQIISQALMDFGSIVCTSKKPNCKKCVLIHLCDSFSKDLVEKIPFVLIKSKKQTRYGVIFWVENTEGMVLLQKRPNKGLYKGMMEFPSTPWREKNWDFASAKEYSPVKTKWHDTKIIVKHSLSHFNLVLNIYSGKIEKINVGTWVNLNEIKNYALPTVMKKIAEEFV
tara:strand:+ start:697 stop:1731 length:1035 start_codon:yes stop_codon:yes gene_type:complete